HQIETQPLGSAQRRLAQLVQAGKILVRAVFEKRPPPEGAGGAIDHVDAGRWLIVHQNIAPLEVVMGETTLVHQPRGVGYLPHDLPQPVRVAQPWVVIGGKPGEILGAVHFLGDHGPSVKCTPAPFHAVPHNRGGPDTPPTEQQQIAPLPLYPRPPDQPAQPAALGVITLHVVAAVRDPDVDHFTYRVLSDLLALQGKYRIKVGESFSCRAACVLRIKRPGHGAVACCSNCCRSSITRSGCNRVKHSGNSWRRSNCLASSRVGSYLHFLLMQGAQGKSLARCS